jgi:hypothetical protein
MVGVRVRISLGQVPSPRIEGGKYAPGHPVENTAGAMLSKAKIVVADE